MTKVSPGANVARENWPSMYAAKGTVCWADVEAQRRYAARFAGVGGARYMTLAPLTTWYQTDVPPKSKCRSV